MNLRGKESEETNLQMKIGQRWQRSSRTLASSPQGQWFEYGRHHWHKERENGEEKMNKKFIMGESV
jgi:hypothetical protein